MVYSNQWGMDYVPMLESSMGGNAEMNIIEIILVAIIAAILLFIVIGSFILDCDRKRKNKKSVTRSDMKIRKMSEGIKRRFPWLFY